MGTRTVGDALAPRRRAEEKAVENGKRDHVELGVPPAQARRIFAGLMLGMLMASLNLTIVSPALPRIVADLGGMQYYSWIALSAALASAVVVPVVGKLGDLYGRKPFYSAGLIVFMTASMLSGIAPTHWWLIGSRLLQGIGMGMLMPLSQAIIGDIAPPRERSKYQGLIGTAFGLGSVSGPPIGGWIAQTFSWRWLFYINVPFGLLALFFILRFLHLRHVPRRHQIDYVGSVTLTVGLIAVLLATSWGGSQYPWGSAPIIGLYGAGAVLLAVFLWWQRRAPEPVMPLYLWKNRTFAASSIASFALAMGMFGAIVYVPVFAQGVMGVSIARSGFAGVAMDAALIFVGAVNGFLISRSGHFRPQMLFGLPIMGLGYFVLYNLTVDSSYAMLLLGMGLVGFGIGSAMHTYTVVVQAAVPYRDMGVATGIIQFFRNVGNTVGTATLGTVMTVNLQREIPRRLPPDLTGETAELARSVASGDGIAVLFDPARLAALPPDVTAAIRQGAAAAFKPLFAAGFLFVAVTIVATLFLDPETVRSAQPPTITPEHAEAAQTVEAGSRA